VIEAKERLSASCEGREIQFKVAASMARATVAPDKSLRRATEFIIRAAPGMVNKIIWGAAKFWRERGHSRLQSAQSPNRERC
jgi:hypothetical protein